MGRDPAELPIPGLLSTDEAKAAVPSSPKVGATKEAIEAALRKTVADIQIKLGLSVNDHRCKKIVSRAVALVRKNSN